MDQCNLLDVLGQASLNDVEAVFLEYLRGGVRQMLLNVMVSEVEALCGRKYHPDEASRCQRAGSAPGYVVWDGRREEVKRPRVRRKKGDNSTEEVQLQAYELAQQSGQLREMVMRALTAGVSSREMKEVYPSSPSVSKSNVSRLWIREGAKFVEELRSRDLRAEDWLVLVVDGVVLSKDQTAIVAVGITADGTKHVLDFALGSTENYEVCCDLMRRLVERGFAPKRRLLALLDGSKALRKGVKQFFSDALIQRCLVHKERNLRAKLSKRDWGELARLFKRLREVQGEKSAREVLAELEGFLAKKNAEALASLREAGDELITLHKLEVPSTLHKSLLSTNIIENSFRNTRRKLGRVTRFRAETDQASRWLAYALLETEKGFRRIQGHTALPTLAKALERSSPHPTGSEPAWAAIPLRPTASAPPPPKPASS